jgi:rod shape determining protein RodA
LFVLIEQLKGYLTSHIAWAGYVLVIVLLALTMVTCTITRGTCSWIELGGSFHLQSSQLAVAFVGLAISMWLSTHSLSELKNVGIFLALVGLPAALILIEPDLGTTVIFILSVGSCLFVGPSRWSHLGILTVLAAIVIAAGWVFVVKDYQKERVFSFVAGTQVASDAHYNAQQALIAVGSGQLWGQGLGQGIQSHLRFLPERQTDFIFASLAEEWGFLGSSALIFLYAVLIGGVLYLSFSSNSLVAHYFGCITAIFLTFQTVVNIGMNMGLFPITGITLPFVSYGGSSILSLYIHLGILQAVAAQQATSHQLHIG